MNVPYDDILSRIPEPPLWWSSGVPRYAPFEPKMMSVYASEAMLLETQCQSCGREFALGICSESGEGGRLRAKLTGPDRMWGWADPPSHACHGDSMNVVVLSVLEFWQKVDVPGSALQEWERQPMLEKALHR